jgi:hypothetical protein
MCSAIIKNYKLILSSLLLFAALLFYKSSNLVNETLPSQHCKYGVSHSTNQKAIGQSSSDLNELYKEAFFASREFFKLVNNIAKATGGKARIPPLKTKNRAEQKGLYRYNGDYSRITDILRATITYPTYQELKKQRDKIESSLDLVVTCDRFSKPLVSGYRDINIILRLSNGHLAELQIHLEPIFKIKKMYGDIIYKENQGLKYLAKKEQRRLTFAEIKIINDNNQFLKQLYNKAFLGGQES